MNSLLLQFVLLIGGLATALPPGWCHNRTLQHDRDAASVACCHVRHESTDRPPASAGECCCSWDATLPQRFVEQADTLRSALPVAVVVIPVAVDTFQEIVAPFTPVRDGPRLHLLQCVWLC